MKSVILHILCEGQTEERFVKEVLAPYLRSFAIFAKPILLLTSRKKNARGGMLSYSQARRDLSILKKQFTDNDSERHVFTTMFDYYALPDDFPGFEEAAAIPDPRKRIDFLERKLYDDFANRAFVPYIQLHEFEALMFSDITKLESDYPQSLGKILELKAETDPIGDPELINNNYDTAPSRRISRALADKYHYNKVRSGASVTALIGMDALLKKCQHFREWVERLTSFA